jgi:hypothetical protein
MAGQLLSIGSVEDLSGNHSDSMFGPFLLLLPNIYENNLELIRVGFCQVFEDWLHLFAGNAFPCAKINKARPRSLGVLASQGDT